MVHYVTPTQDNLYQPEKMTEPGIFANVHQDVGEFIVADVNAPRIAKLLNPERWHSASKRIRAGVPVGLEELAQLGRGLWKRHRSTRSRAERGRSRRYWVPNATRS